MTSEGHVRETCCILLLEPLASPPQHTSLLDWRRSNTDERNVVDEISVRRNQATLILETNSSCSITKLRFHKDLPCLSCLHPNDPLVEAWDHLLLPDLEGDRLASLARVVEDGAVSKVRDVVDDNKVSLVHASGQPAQDPIVLLLVDVGQARLHDHSLTPFLARLLCCKYRKSSTSSSHRQALDEAPARELLVEAHAKSAAGGARWTEVSRNSGGGEGVGEFGHRSEDDGEGSNPGAHFDTSGRDKKTCNGGTA
mmetsp:Transcript_3586/g.12607  ORF Transcript_3586/g.12607 Transcript_3586/m.12607 type:complete len:254 (-) Transcript_3586:46-807(-)